MNDSAGGNVALSWSNPENLTAAERYAMAAFAAHVDLGGIGMELLKYMIPSHSGVQTEKDAWDVVQVLVQKGLVEKVLSPNFGASYRLAASDWPECSCFKCNARGTKWNKLTRQHEACTACVGVGIVRCGTVEE